MLVDETDADLADRSYVLLPCKEDDITCGEVAHILVVFLRSSPKARLTRRMEGTQLRQLAGAKRACVWGLDKPHRFVEGVPPAPVELRCCSTTAG
jgi:hypothetical protein